MGLIIEQVEIKGTVKSIKVSALIDSGAEGNYIGAEVPLESDRNNLDLHLTMKFLFQFQGHHSKICMVL